MIDNQDIEDVDNMIKEIESISDKLFHIVKQSYLNDIVRISESGWRKDLAQSIVSLKFVYSRIQFEVETRKEFDSDDCDD